MKKIKKIFIIGLMCLLLPFNVYAETIKNDNGYEFEITKIETPSCITESELTFLYHLYPDGGMIYVTYTEDLTDVSYAYVSSDGTCTIPSTKQLLELEVEEPSISYEMEAFSSNKIEITKITSYDDVYDINYILTEDTEINTNKEYWKLEYKDETYYTNNVPEPKVNELATYYEQIYYSRPTSTTIDSKTTYYKLEELEEGSGWVILKKVESPKAEEILDYYVKYTGETEEKREVVDTISNAKFGSFAYNLGHTNFGVQPLGTSGKYQFFVKNSVEDAEGYISTTYDIYDKDANKLFGELDGYDTINDDMFFTLKDGKATIYGKDLKALYTLENAIIVGTGATDNENIYYLVTNLTTAYKIELKNVPDITYTISNPNTSDQIIISVIIGVVSVIGLFKITKFLRRKTRLV